MLRCIYLIAAMATLWLIFSPEPRVCVAEEPAAANWPQFRGADASGVSHNAGLPDKWSSTENVEWKTEIPGRGWGSPVVWGDNVFLPTVVNTGTTEPLKKGLYFGGDQGNPLVHPARMESALPGSGQWQCSLREKTIRTGTPTESIHLKNSYASETPVTDGEQVLFCFGNIGLFCFDFKGEQSGLMNLHA